ncbi:MAG: hypothetical protein WC799_21280 [Desulfobacteraceae bacterium]
MLNKTYTRILVIILCLFLSACGQAADENEDKTGLNGTGFQDNGSDKEYPHFVLTGIFKGWGGLEEMWNSIDADGFNDRFNNTVNSFIDEFITFSHLGSSILGDDSRVVILLAGTDASKLLGYLIDPTENYPVRNVNNSDGHYFSEESTDYTEGFYAFLDEVFKDGENPGSADMVAVNWKILNRFNDMKSPEELHEDMEELIDDILDPDFKEDFIDLTSMLGKLLVRADYPLSADDESMGIGNAAKGVVDLVMWYNRMEKDPVTRALLRSQVSEAVSMFDPSLSSTNNQKIHKLLENIKDYFTESGSVYGSDNPDNVYRMDNDEIYSVTEITNTVREMVPSTAQLLMRSDRTHSLIESKDGENVYVLRQLMKNLNSLGYDPDAVDMEKSLMNMMKYDCIGRDRTNPSSGAYPASHLESLLFVTHVTSNMGWADLNEDSVDEVMEPTDPRYDHGHGSYTGRLSLNDSLFSIKTHKTMNSLGLFDISLKANDGENIHRSMDPFTTMNRENFNFFYDQNYDILNCLAPPCAGDLGSPNGGNPDVVNQIIPGMNGYKAYSPDGLEEPQLAAWTLGLIVRACFNGEGPYYYADPEAERFMVETQDWFIYRRPSGKIYAYVNKDDPENWEYFYPVDGNDPIDPDLDGKVLGNIWQRYNRYKSEWQSDYYMSHYLVRRQVNGVPVVEDRFATMDNSSGNLEIAPVTGGGLAGRLTYRETIAENDPLRACSSPEEALFRNYQWFMSEKKLVIIMPLKVDLDGTQASIFQVLEANGLSGLGNLRKFKGNHFWAKSNSDGDSKIPGDYRIEVVSSSLGEDSPLNDFNVYYNTLDCGHATPTIVGANLPALVRLGFPRFTTQVDRTQTHTDSELGSKEFAVGDRIWQDRSAVLAPFIALISALREFTPQDGYGVNPLKRGIHMFVEGTSPLLKPLIYYQKENGQHPHLSWKPRIMGSGENGPSDSWGDYIGDDFLRSSADFHNNPYRMASAWNGTVLEQRYYQPSAMKNLLNVLIDSDVTSAETRLDGILPVMMENKSPTRLLKALLSNPNDSDRLYSALEQIVGALKITKGRFTQINENPEKSIYYPEFMFVAGAIKGYYDEFISFIGQRDEDIILDIGLDRLIGHPAIDDVHDGYGLVQYVDEQLDEGWDDLDDKLDLLEDLLHPSSPYSVVESALSMNEKVFGRDRLYTEEEIKGLTYALGKLLTHYDVAEDIWLNQGEEGFDDLLTILQVRLPQIHELMKDGEGFSGDNYKAALTINADMMKPGGPVEFLVSNMETQVDWETLLADSARFVADDLITGDKPLWSTFSELLNDLAVAVDRSKDGSLMDQVYANYGFQRNN